MNKLMLSPMLAMGWGDIVWLLALALVGLLIFGKRLPEMGRSLGKGITEFKKGLAGVEEEVKKPAENGKAELPAGVDKQPELEAQLRASQEQVKQLNQQITQTQGNPQGKA